MQKTQFVTLIHSESLTKLNNDQLKNLKIIILLNINSVVQREVYILYIKISKSNQSRFTLKAMLEDFPGSAVVNNLPAKAGDLGSIPGPRSFHMPQSNKACAPQLLSPCALDPCSTREVTTVRSPYTATRD